MFQVQKLLVTALDSKASILQSVGSDVSELLSEWNEQAVQLQSSVNVVSEDSTKAEVAVVVKDQDTIEMRIDSGEYLLLENHSTLSLLFLTRIKGVTTPVEEFPTAITELDKLADSILDILQRYGKHLAPKDNENTSTEWLGKPMFHSRVVTQLQKGEPIKMILPAFPWKSVSHKPSLFKALPPPLLTHSQTQRSTKKTK